tara:strand:- start:278 stop:523 length:246 start_codon:yes stop_codon:yes gene_type:complete
MSDPWKREEVQREGKYEQQLELQLNTVRDATPEEVEEWLEKELLPLGEKQLPFIAMMAMIQFLCLVGMFSAFWLIDRTFNG